MSDTLSVSRGFVEVMPYLHPDDIKVFLVLVDWASSDLAVGLTLNALARAANVGQQGARDALERLTTPTQRATVPLSDVPFITMTKRSKWTDIRVHAQWMADSKPIKFSYDDTDATRIGKMEAETRRIASLTTGSSGLAETLRDTEERDIILLVEKQQGHALSVSQSWMIAKSVGMFGPARFKLAYRASLRDKNPLVAAFAKLLNGAYGDRMPEKEIPSMRGPKYPKRG